MSKYLEENGSVKARSDNKVVVFKKFHDDAYGHTYAAVNKTDRTVIIELDMTKSYNLVFMPPTGKIVEVLKPHELKHLGASIISPQAFVFKDNYTFKTSYE